MTRDFDAEIQALKDKIANIETEKAEAEKNKAINASMADIMESGFLFVKGMKTMIDGLSLVMSNEQIKNVKNNLLTPDFLAVCWLVADNEPEAKPLVDFLKASKIPDLDTFLNSTSATGTAEIKDEAAELEDVLNDFLKSIGA